MRNSKQRHRMITEQLKVREHVSVTDLSEITSVSEVTIRKDLQELEDQGLLYRTYGGASRKNLYTSDRPIHEKELLHSEEKQKIAEAALSMIGQHDSIIIASGTTVFTVAQKLNPVKHLTVITPAPKVALELSGRANIEVMQLGGFLRPLSSSVFGHNAEAMLEEISCGILFLGVDGIDLEKGLTVTNLPEAKLNQKMMQAAEVTVVLADSSKFGKRGLSKICSVDRVQYIITDKGVSAVMIKAIEETGVKVILV